MTNFKHLLQQTIKTSKQNAVFAQSDGDIRIVEIGLHSCVIFVDLGVKIDATYYYDLLLSQQFAACHTSCL